MRLHRFYISGYLPEKSLSRGTFVVPRPDMAHQLKSVFRFRRGDHIGVFSGDGQDHECIIETLDKDSISLKLVKSESSRFMPGRKVYLCASVVKKDTFEWIAEKATELGVTDILPILSERSEKKSLNMERLEKIVIEASEQSGRGDVPKLHPILELEKSLEYIKSQAGNDDLQAVAFHTEAEPMQEPLFDTKGTSVVYIGPEGGWSEAELAWFHKENIPVVSLGKQVLRAETAVIAALAKVIL